MTTRKILQACMLSAALVASAAVYAASPSVDQVYQAARAGRYTDAQAMMDQVLKEHPDSGRAHYVQAELLAKQGQYDRAREELATAERLAPGLPFAKAASVQGLRTRLNGTSTVESPVVPAGTPTVQSGLPAAQYGPDQYSAPREQRSSGEGGGGFGFMPIVFFLVIAGVAFFIVRGLRGLRRRNNPQQAGYPGGYGGQGLNGGFGNNGQAPGNYGYGQQPMGPGYQQPGSGLGSRIAGGLATGAALGAGMVAGEAIARQFTHRDEGGHSAASSFGNESSGLDPIQPDNFDMGGNDFGLNDSSSWDDSGGGGGGDDDWT